MTSKKDYINEKIYYARALEEVKFVKRYEKKITNNLKKLSKQYGGKLLGLQYKIKDPVKVMFKLKLKGENYQLRDILRYTIVFPTDEYVKGVYNIFIDLMNDTTYKTKHAWVKQRWCVGDMYQGINTSWLYNNNFIFELQFHTYESFDAKTYGDLHDVYDDYNKHKCEHIYIGDKDYIMKRCRNKRNKMIKLEDKIPVPPELENDKCGYDIEEWYKLLNIPSKLKRKMKRKMKRKSKRKSNRKSKRKSKSKRKD